MEENNLLNETNQSSKKELQTIVVHLEEQLKEQNSKLEILNTEVGQKAELQSRLKELEEHLAIAEDRVKEENESSSQKKLEQEASLNKQVVLLENQVKELEQKLQLADSKLKEKDAKTTREEIELKSREIEFSTSTPTKRKSRKKSEPSSAQTPSSDTHVKPAEVSPATTFKFVLGVALISVIVGIILGKRY
ncbi:myosin-2 heavy chain [Olea europaea subsp. europaea]|uniref:Myosin-2 heavy chain n=2 Tax=Olea europaea subsp. europaea TaxID=158383 RepID=A0A8S0T6X3_OLEEU|nr:myosin-2 heavy chain [Olea europaea subsp. europaea]